ncbi:MFS transporter [Pengzhenrongella frigida]|uniref:MFS transporter n=1 Tax=Pengzhenrongella frigida TaxID=1259133 RepID=A0A4Q5MXH0_9MICO|nr:MFS transporter [Cellulomonas sp. HLT2-17]RYV49633.1 MFS transporter [Cellulomonas sp. HLT2-17]
MPARTASSPSRTSHPTAILTIILISYVMIIIDNSIIITGLPRIQDDLEFSPTGLSWVQNAYTLTFGGLLLLGARAGDLLGRRRVFLLGLTWFTLASVVVGAAPSGGLLVAARAMQGVGSAILAPSTLALLTATFAEGPARTRAVAAYGSVAGIGAALGLVLGGFIAAWLSWRVGFFINLPIGVVLVWAVRRYVPVTEGRPGRLDLTGAFTSTLGMTSLVYGIVRSADTGWDDLGTLAALVAGALLLAGFVVVESRVAQPIMPLRLFASRERNGAYAARLLFIGAMISYFLFLSQFLQGVFGYTPLQAGAAFLPMTIINFAVALTVPRLTATMGGPRLLALGVAVTFVGMAWLSRLGTDGSYLVSIALPLVLIGAGQGFAFGPLTAAGISGVTARDAGAASGVINAAHQLGGALGLGVLVTVAAAATSGSSAVERLASGVTAALTGSAVMLALALALVLLLIVRRRPGSRPGPPVPQVVAGELRPRRTVVQVPGSQIPTGRR